MIYSARYDTMNALLAYLTENCCRGHADECLPEKSEKRLEASVIRRKTL
jgi:hypothetical protein